MNAAPATPWTGAWVSSRLDIELSSHSGIPLQSLVGLAVRRNPKRAQLLVSNVLGKHVPARPSTVIDAGTRLGELVVSVLGDVASSAAVIGFAETATALGQLVADALQAYSLHSTRRSDASWQPYEGFEESHSHAVGHMLFPESADILDAGGPIVLVDDELSTGRTALALIRALHARSAHAVYVIAALIDVRSQTDREMVGALAAELGVDIHVVGLGVGDVKVPSDVLTRGMALVESLPPASPPRAFDADWTTLESVWPATCATTARHGNPVDYGGVVIDELAQPVAAMAARMKLQTHERLLVLGTEELMYAPLRIASALESSADVTFQSTTRSPVLAVDDPGYAIRSARIFEDPEGSGAPRFVYNAHEFYDHVLVVIDDAMAQPQSLFDNVASVAQNHWIMQVHS